MNRYRIISGPPPPPVGTAAKLLSPGPIPFLFIIFGVMIILAGCPSPGGGDPGQTGNPVKPVTPPKPKTYTTIVSGKVTTPAGNAVTQYDTATRRSVPSGEDAEVRVSTDSSVKTVKAAVAADGSYTLSVTHPGTFILSVDYPAGRDYKAGSPQNVTTTKAAHTRDIALKYGYTTTLSGQVVDASTAANRNGATVTASVEGREAERTVSSTIGGNVGSYSITFDHPGSFRFTGSFEGRMRTYSLTRWTAVNLGRNILVPSS